MPRVYIGLGSNLDDPRQQLESALQSLEQLPATDLVAVSSFYTSDSLSPGQPRYTNAVAALDSALEPIALLDALQSIENAQGRVRKERWGHEPLTWISCSTATRLSMNHGSRCRITTCRRVRSCSTRWQNWYLPTSCWPTSARSPNCWPIARSSVWSACNQAFPTQ